MIGKAQWPKLSYFLNNKPLPFKNRTLKINKQPEPATSKMQIINYLSRMLITQLLNRLKLNNNLIINKQISRRCTWMYINRRAHG